MCAELQKPYFGGSQMWSSNSAIHDYGCGAVAGYDLFRYLSGSMELIDKNNYLSRMDYSVRLESFSKLYFPVLGKLGINGISLASGLNKVFRKYDLPYRAKWAVSRDKLFARIK